MKNQFDVEHAFPGICSLCFKEIADFRGSDPTGKPRIDKFHSDFSLVELQLNDNSFMSVSLCSKCASDLDKKDYKKIMKSECDGWDWELKHCLKHWTRKQKDKYRRDYYSKTIKGHNKPHKRSKD